MTIHEFAELVAEMRDAQKRFFKGDRSAECLQLAKSLERRVDKAVAEVNDSEQKLF